jgi:hypothetical protein
MTAYSFSAETCRLVLLLCAQNTVLTVRSLHFAHTVYFYSLCDSDKRKFFPQTTLVFVMKWQCVFRYVGTEIVRIIYRLTSDFQSIR